MPVSGFICESALSRSRGSNMDFLQVVERRRAARDAGVGTCWIGFGRPWLDLPETKSELGIPENCHVVAPIVMGHATAWPETRGRHAAEIHWLTP
jgi:hypothetical protein